MPKASLVNGEFKSGLQGWSATGDAFVVFSGPGGKPHVTTYGKSLGDAAVGRIWQELTVDATTSELAFTVHGGDARVLLMLGDEVVRASQGRRSNSEIVPVVWNLEKLRGRKVRLVVDDALKGDWGFVSVSGFQLR